MTDDKKDMKEQPLPLQVGVYGVILAICFTIMALLLRIAWWAVGGCG